MSGWGRSVFQFNDSIQKRGGIWQGPIPYNSPAGRTISRDDYETPSPSSSRPSSSHGSPPPFAQATQRWSPPSSPRVASLRESPSPVSCSPERVDSAHPFDTPTSSPIEEKEHQAALAEKLYAASFAGDLAHMQLLLSLGAPVNVPTLVPNLYTAFKPPKSGFLSPLAGAASAGHLPACRLLLAHGANINPGMRESSSSPLHQACRADDPATADFLLARGAHIDGLNCYKTSPLMYAVKYGSAPLVRLLLAHAPDLAQRSFIGTAAIHWAIWPGHEDLVALLLQAGADADMRVADGATPLHCAASSGLTGVAKVLLAYGADPGKRNDEWRTPGQVARERGYGECAGVLEIAEQVMRK